MKVTTATHSTHCHLPINSHTIHLLFILKGDSSDDGAHCHDMTVRKDQALLQVHDEPFATE